MPAATVPDMTPTPLAVIRGGMFATSESHLQPAAPTGRPAPLDRLPGRLTTTRSCGWLPAGWSATPLIPEAPWHRTL